MCLQCFVCKATHTGVTVDKAVDHKEGSPIGKTLRRLLGACVRERATAPIARAINNALNLQIQWIDVSNAT
jgi:hypothetical protein